MGTYNKETRPCLLGNPSRADHMAYYTSQRQVPAGSRPYIDRPAFAASAVSCTVGAYKIHELKIRGLHGSYPGKETLDLARVPWGGRPATHVFHTFDMENLRNNTSLRHPPPGPPEPSEPARYVHRFICAYLPTHIEISIKIPDTVAGSYGCLLVKCSRHWNT